MSGAMHCGADQVLFVLISDCASTLREELEFWNYAERSHGRHDDFANLVDVLRGSIPKKPRAFANVYDPSWLKTHESRTGCIRCNRIIG